MVYLVSLSVLALNSTGYGPRITLDPAKTMTDHAAQDNSMRTVQHVPKFDGTNYREWNYEMDLAFQQLDINQVVSGVLTCPEEVTNGLDKFIFNRNIVIAMLVISCSPMSTYFWNSIFHLPFK